VRNDATNIIQEPEEMKNCGKTTQMVTMDMVIMDMGFTVFKTSKIMFTYNY
jgi:hypothetical protein